MKSTVPCCLLNSWPGIIHLLSGRQFHQVTSEREEHSHYSAVAEHWRLPTGGPDRTNCNSRKDSTLNVVLPLKDNKEQNCCLNIYSNSFLTLNIYDTMEIRTRNISYPRPSTQASRPKPLDLHPNCEK